MISVCTVAAMSGVAFAGGDFHEVVEPVIVPVVEVDNSSFYLVLGLSMEGVYWNGALEVDADAITMGVNYKF